MYTIVQDVSKNTRAKMESKHVMFSKDGMKVEVKEVQDEAYKDQTQRCVCSVGEVCTGVKTMLMVVVVSLSICGTTLPSRLIKVGCGI